MNVPEKKKHVTIHYHNRHHHHAVLIAQFTLVLSIIHCSEYCRHRTDEYKFFRSTNTGVSICVSPGENFAYEFVPASPAGTCSFWIVYKMGYEWACEVLLPGSV